MQSIQIMQSRHAGMPETGMFGTRLKRSAVQATLPGNSPRAASRSGADTHSMTLSMTARPRTENGRERQK